MHSLSKTKALTRAPTEGDRLRWLIRQTTLPVPTTRFAALRCAEATFLPKPPQLALLVGPVILANVVVPDGGQDRVEAAAESQTSLVALRRSASVADLAKGNAAMSLRTTTTPPPPPPTEPPPPPTTEPPTTAPPATEPEPASTE